MALNYYNPNRSLNNEEMKVNAKYLCGLMLVNGWTLNAICGILGNMQSESRVNPGAFEGYTDWREKGINNKGYGLTQWTPYGEKIFDFARDRNLPVDEMETQLLKIEDEVTNRYQFYSTSSYKITFSQFKVSTLSPYWLGGAFLVNYERPRSGNKGAEKRGNAALAWWDFFNGGELPNVEPPNGGGGISPYGQDDEDILFFMKRKEY